MEFLQYCADLGIPVGPSLVTGNGTDFLIGRVSYSFGLTGPCVRYGCTAIRTVARFGNVLLGVSL